jgi:lipopolysaccharide biosynthesis regulator YciM
VQQRALNFFEDALAGTQPGQPKHIESMMGKARLLEKQKHYDEALEALTEISIQNKDFFPALLEKSKLHMINGDWE